MNSVDFLFDFIVRFSVLAFCLLGVSLLLLQRIKQPLERVRLIQLSLSVLVVVMVLISFSGIPSILIPILPADTAAETVITPLPDINNTEPVKNSVAQNISPALTTETTVADSYDGTSLSTVTDQASDHHVQNSLGSWQTVRLLTASGFLLISAVQLVYLLVGLALTWRLLSRATQLNGSNHERVRTLFSAFTPRTDIQFAMSDRIQVPLVCGLFRPTILLPQTVVEDTDELALQHSLAHEWSHIQKHDLMTWQLASLCQILLWPQPFFWKLKRELRVSQDQIADQFAARHTDQPAEYAATLVAFSQQKVRLSMGALAMADYRSSLYRRVEMLLSDSFHISPRCRIRIVLAVLSVMLLIAVPLASLKLTRATAADSKVVKAEADQNQDTDQDKQTNQPVSAEKDEQPAAVTHSGVIVDAFTDKPIPGATVIVTRMNSGDWRELAVTESITDANGKYTFTIPPDQLKQRLLYIMFDLRHPEYAPRHCGSYGYGMIQKNLKLGAAPWFKKLPMVPGTTITGRLIDESGQPVAHAEIRASSSDPQVDGFLEGSSSMDTTTDESGNFEISLTKNGTASMSFIPREHCMKHIDLGTKRDDLGDITVTRGKSLHGVVRDARGNPVPDVWVNLTDKSQERNASYEMKRSSKTNAKGEFTTRPVQPGEYLVEVQTKATGAIEKQKYANFHDEPPPAMFVRQVIEVTAETFNQPLNIQAVPHIYISGKSFDSKGKPRGIHSPHVMGKINGQFVFIREGLPTKKGEFKLMVPHGLRDARLNFTTNEHSALTVQFPGKKASPLRHINYPVLEEDLTDIRVVRYVAPILQVRVVDESDEIVDEARVNVTYSAVKDNKEPNFSTTSFERQDDGVYRSSSLCPDLEFTVQAVKGDRKTEVKTMTMKEGENDVITLTLQDSEKSKPGE